MPSMFGLRFVFAGRFSDRGECRVRRDVSVCGMPLHPMSACFYDAYWFLCFRIDLSIVWIAYNHCLRRRRARHAALTTLPRNRAVKWAHTTDTPTQDPDTRQSRRLFYLSFQADYCVDPPAMQQRTSSEASFNNGSPSHTCSRTTRHSAVRGRAGSCPRHLQQP